MAAQAFNPSTREAEAGRALSSRPAWSTGASSRTARTVTQRNLVSKNQNQKTKQNNKIMNKEKCACGFERGALTEHKETADSQSSCLSFLGAAITSMNSHSCQCVSVNLFRDWGDGSVVKCFIVCFVFQGRVSLCSSGCPGISSLN